MATVAHELRNPMSAITNTLFTLRQSVNGSGLDLERPMNRLERSVARCDRIINDLVDFSNLREIQCRPLSADKWLGDLLDEQKLSEGVVLQRHLGAAGQLANIDPTLMRRAMVNLIENASQALTEEGKNLRERRITIGSDVTADWLAIIVEDTGIGIAPDILPKVFEPLFSTRSFGTGLGLAVVKQVVDQHSGKITIESKPGHGTRVVILLPLDLPAGSSKIAA